MEKRKVLVTGSTGLVGNHILIDLMHDQQTELYALKRSSSNLDLVKKLFEWYNQSDLYAKIQWIEGDINEDLSHLFEKHHFDEVIHTAAIVSFDPNDYAAMQQTNVKATQNLLNASKKYEVKKFGFISSIAALGRVSEGGLYDENATWHEGDANSYYSKTKYQAEQSVIDSNSDLFKTYLINPGVILGPCDWNKSSGTLFRTASKGLLFYTKGKNGFVDVRDVSKGLLKIMQVGQPGERYIAVGDSVTYRFVFDSIATAFGKRSAKFYAPPILTGLGWRLSSMMSKIRNQPPVLTKESARSAHAISQYNNSKLQDLKGFSFTPIETSITDACNFFKHF